MLRVGDRVYHTGVRANGIITEIDETKIRDKYKVRFFWGKYCTRIKHGEWDGRVSTKWQWCEEANLISIPYWGEGFNKVTSIGGRSLDRLIRNVCEIDRRRQGDYSNIVIVYGQSNHAVVDVPLVLNNRLIMDKYTQMRLLGEQLALESHQTRPGVPVREDWIIKPSHSIGGRGIRPDDGNDLRFDEYYQRKFNKVREFRVHCFLWMDEPVQLIMEKFVEDPSQLCWNKKQGASWKHFYQYALDVQRLEHGCPFDVSIFENIKVNSVEALKLLQYDFGGIDFGMDAEGNLKIFEVNSRMGLREQSLFTYKKVIDQLRRLNIPNYKQSRGWGA